MKFPENHSRIFFWIITESFFLELDDSNRANEFSLYILGQVDQQTDVEVHIVILANIEIINQKKTNILCKM